ncbi:hypothetical protein GSI_00954 [Ganoderma sinense ZZ0214-1]|uniref:Uncharacterized protein n=1 Tax=Ganoderma sinense ZZ0214-1 TaxID=1077348 RepID=A0A2G8SU05_9APHY|nr:hypothetical protein GSI_00954 [Ganoderma sinense ZZ0214-1]
MCYAVGSLQQATSTCPMCKVFRPSGARCPHIKEVCRNSTNHPRHDVIYLKNAEGQVPLALASVIAVRSNQRSGPQCRHSKAAASWAKTSPPSSRAGYQNPGWPGCCRPPNPQEIKLIGAADWPAVSLVYRIAIPQEIKLILDGIYAGQTSPRGTPPLPTTTNGSMRGTSAQTTVAAAAPGISRRSSYNVASPTRTDSSSTTRTNPVAIPTKGRSGSGGSPQQTNATLSPRIGGGGGDGTPPSLSNAAAMEQSQSSRRSAMDVFADKRPDPLNTTQNSPGRKAVELYGTMSRRSSEQRRPSISSITGSAPVSKGSADQISQRRRTLTTSTTGASPPSNPPLQDKTSTAPARSPDRPAATERPAEAAPARRGSTIEEAVIDKVEKLSLSSSASSGSSGDSSETAGGFTDYLSDESEAELQRQAEAKAAIVAQNQMEELEFRAARQQLADVDLRPPKSWRGEMQSTPRSQVSVANRSSTAATYGRAAFVGAPAYAASTSRG